MGKNERPTIVAFEGLDGAGKTTHIKTLVDDMEKLGLRVATASSPAKNWMGTILRTHIGDLEPQRKDVLFTYEIERTQRRIPLHVDVVLWDRHLDSVIVSNTDDAKPKVDALATRITRPDKVIYLDITPETSWDREGHTSDHPINRKWIESKHERYGRLIRENPGRFEVIDASQPLGVVYNAILQYLIRELKPTIEQTQELYDRLFNTEGIVRFLIENPAEVKPGVFLPMFMNFKSTWSNLEARNYFSEKLVESIGDDYDWVIGLESGGSYYATSVSNQLNKPLSLLRKSDKDYGDRNFIVGDLPPAGSRVALVDDVYATGQSGSRAVEKLTAMGCSSTLFTIFSYSSDVEMTRRLGIEATSLTNFKALRARAIERGVISDAQADLLTKQVDVYRNTVFQ